MNPPFTWSYVALVALQALAVLGPRGPLTVAALRRRWWLGLIPLAAIGGMVVALGYSEALVQRMVDLAAVATPLLALAGWWAFRARWAALAVPVLYWLAWQRPATRAGELAGDLLIVGACATLAWLTGALAPRWALAVGIVVTAAIDVWQVLQVKVQPVADALAVAAPPSGLPHLQQLELAGSSMGWGDVYLAALLGVVVSGSRRRLTAATIAVLVGGVVEGYFFVLIDVLPATVPVAFGLLVAGLVDRASVREWWSGRGAAAPAGRENAYDAAARGEG